LLRALQGEHAEAWHDAWTRFIIDCLVQHAYRQIDFVSGKPRANFNELDDPVKRSELALNDSTASQVCCELLVTSSAVLNGVLRAEGLRPQSKAQLRKLLVDHGIVTALIATPTSAGKLVSINLEYVWPSLADRIGRDIYSAEWSDAPEPEWLLWNKLLLSRFFQGCRLAAARHVSAHLGRIMRGLHGPSASLIAIVERVDSDGISDPPLPPVPILRLSIGFSTARFSDLLSAIRYESDQIPAHRGLVHRVVDMDRPAAIPIHLRTILTHSQLVEYRDRSYRQYEASILCYGVLSAIEQLLRSLATRTGVTHFKKAGYPAPVGEWLDNAKLALDPVLLNQLRQLHSPNGPNLRNRAMHAGLLETDSKRADVLLAPNSPKLWPSLSKDPLVAQNLLEICMQNLRALDAFVATAGLSAEDFFWARQIWLSPDELEFGHQLHCDVLDPELSFAWQRELFDFVDSSIACFSTYVKVAWHGWMKSFERHDSLLSFLVWGVVFEGIFRTTLHTMGFDVIQRSPINHVERMFQYRILDERQGGLCRPETISALVRDLNPQARPLAARTINLAVKTRNALSHGALVAHDDFGHIGAGHLFIKAIQLLMFATVQHMTRIGAYYRSLRRPTSAFADPTDDWLAAEDQIYDTIAKLAAEGRSGRV
jgi:hypothetical protein